jgi:hypothetical protein
VIPLYLQRYKAKAEGDEQDNIIAPVIVLLMGKSTKEEINNP